MKDGYYFCVFFLFVDFLIHVKHEINFPCLHSNSTSNISIFIWTSLFQNFEFFLGKKWYQNYKFWMTDFAFRFDCHYSTKSNSFRFVSVLAGAASCFIPLEESCFLNMTQVNLNKLNSFRLWQSFYDKTWSLSLTNTKCLISEL